MLKVFILLVLVAPLIAYSVKKRSFIYMVFALLPILPDSFAIEISQSLPLLTASRILICCILVEWWIKKKDRGMISLPKVFVIYILFNILISVVNLIHNTGEINRIFILVFEQLILVAVVCELISSNEVFQECIDSLLYGSFILAIIGVCQTILKINLASPLAIVQSAVEAQLPGRMGTIRAFGTSNAIAFACYCAMVILIALYRYENSKRLRYLVVCVANAVALLLSMTRSALLALCIVLALMLVVRNSQMILKYIKFVPIVVVGCIAIFAVAPQLLSSIVETIKSVINVFGANIELSENFGVNANNAVSSRTVQWSAVYYMIQEGKGLFGYGYAAYMRGFLKYFFEQFGRWTSATALDVGFVAIATETGVLGLGSRIAFLGIIGIEGLNKMKNRKGYEFANLFVYFLILYVILNFASSCPDSIVFWLMIALFFAYTKIKGNDETALL